MKNEKAKALTFTGMFAALIFLTTFIHIPTGFNGGYVHIGDALVYLAAVILPMPLAMLAAAIGGGLSDVLTPGAIIWAPATVLIKPLCCLAFTSKNDRLLCGQNLIATVVAGVITIVGYGIASAIITGSIPAAVAEAPFQLIQSTASAVCFVAVAAAMQKSKLKQRISLNKKRGGTL